MGLVVNEFENNESIRFLGFGPTSYQRRGGALSGFHGGMMVSRDAAEKHLSEAARKQALKHGDYYCYEEVA